MASMIEGQDDRPSKKAKSQFKCDLCPKNLNNLKSYLKHVRSHPKEAIKSVWQQCLICQEFFPTDFDRQSHGMKDHSAILKTIQCAICNGHFGSNKEFFQHCRHCHSSWVQEDWFKCRHCDEFRPSRISMNVHVKSSHKAPSEEELPPLILERKFQQIMCKFCPLIFNNSEEFKIHLNSDHKTTGDNHTSDKNISVRDSKPIVQAVQKSNKNGAVECEFCLEMQEFHDRNSYLTHVAMTHPLDMQQSWRQCKDCVSFYPASWPVHGCKPLESNNCPQCSQVCSSADELYGHINLSHDILAFILFPHLCEECGARRPDKTSLMQHKLSHLQSVNGPKIILVTKPMSQNKPNIHTELRDLFCGYCGKKSRGTTHNHFQHARACMSAKKVSLICPYCPTNSFINFNAFKNHAKESHGATSFPILCVWCAKLFSNQLSLNQHVPRCAKELNEAKKTQCEYCPTVFFCEDPYISTFYMAHMNQEHSNMLHSKWGDHWTCSRCKYVFPGQLAYQHHMNLCYQFGNVNKLLTITSSPTTVTTTAAISNQQQPTGTTIIRSTTNNSSNRFIINGNTASGRTQLQIIKNSSSNHHQDQNSRDGSENVTLKVCGICCNSVSGRPKDHFLHARACYLIKQNSPTCLLCPNESFFGRRHYVSHMIEKHQIPADLMLCIVCGYLTSKYDNFAIHSPKCFPAIKEEFRHQCTHCSAYFYFEQDPYNPFYLSHMNQVHHQIVKLSWTQCLKCKGYFPEEYLKTHQEKNCIARLIFRSKLDEPKTAEIPPKKRRIVDAMQITQYKPILPRGGIQIAIEKVEKSQTIQCGLCAQFVQGSSTTFFAHHRICLMKKMNSIICPYCPTLFFDTKQSYIAHLTEVHRPINPLMICVFCGQTLATWFELLKHQAECFPNTTNFLNCEYCDMGFVFPHLDNIFYFAHCNHAHRQKIQKLWSHICTNCGMRFEEKRFLKSHDKMCFQGPDAKKIWSIEAPENPSSLEISEKNTKQMKYNANGNDDQPLDTEIILKTEVFEENTELITGDI